MSSAAEFDEENNNYCGGQNEIDGKVLTLDHHLIKSISISDIENGNTDLRFIRDGARAIADVIGRGANQTVMALFNDTNCPISAAMPTTKEGFAGLIKVAADNSVNPYETTLILSPGDYGNLISKLDYAVLGSDEAVKYGVVENLYGFRSVQWSPFLAEGVKGVMVPYGCVGLASRANKPVLDGYVATWETENPDGFTISWRVFENLCKGRGYIAGDILFGAALLQPKCILLK